MRLRVLSVTLPPRPLRSSKTASPGARRADASRCASCSRRLASGGDSGAWSPAWSERCPSSWATVNRSEEHTSELQSLMRISYAVFCLKKKKKTKRQKRYSIPPTTEYKMHNHDVTTIEHHQQQHHIRQATV